MMRIVELKRLIDWVFPDMNKRKGNKSRIYKRIGKENELIHILNSLRTLMTLSQL